MKKTLVIICLGMLFCGGCWESFALIGGGAAGGMTVSRILEQQQQVIRDDIAMMEAQKAELEQQLAEATDEVEREKLRQQIKNTDVVLMDLRDADEAIARAKEGLNVNWQDPQSVVPFVGAVLMTIFGFWQRRKKQEAEKKQQADKEGREKTLREIAVLTEAEITAPAVKSLMYSNIGAARASKGI